MEQPIVSWRDVRVPLPLRFLYYAFLTNDLSPASRCRNVGERTELLWLQEAPDAADEKR